MQELLPSGTVRDLNAYARIEKLLKAVRDVTSTFESYLRSTQQAYITSTNDCRECCEKFEDDCLKSSAYNSSICEQSLQTRRLLGEICINLHENAEVVLVDLKRFRRQEGVQLLEIFRTHLQRFRERLKNYLDAVDSVVRKELKHYNDSVEQLDESLKELRALVDPLIFYNTAASKEYSKQLQDKYRKASEKESSFKNCLDELQGLKRSLQNDLEQTKKAMVSCLKHHMSQVKEVMRQLIENYLWKKVEKGESSKNPREDKCETQLKQLNMRYDQGSQIDSEMEELGESARSKDLANHQRFFLERCEHYTKNKVESLKCSETLFRKLHQFLADFLRKTQKLDKRFNEASRQPFGVNNIDKYKKDLRKHYGQRISELFEFMVVSIERPTKIFKKLGKSIGAKMDRLSKYVAEHEICRTGFERDVKQLFEEHKKQFVNNSEPSAERVSEFRQSIRITYGNLKRVIGRYDQIHKAIQDKFVEELVSISESVEKESRKAAEQTLAASKNEHINRIVDSEVLAVIKECDKYAVFYDGFFTNEVEVDFRSKIDTPTYCTSSRILARKEDIHRRIGSNQFSLCCFTGKQSKGNKFQCLLIDQNELMNGNLLVFSEGIEYESSNGIFSKKIRLMVPRSDILNVEKREVSSLYSNAILIATEMGQITLANFDKPDVVMGLLHNKFQRKEVPISHSGDSSSVGPGLLSRVQTPCSTKKRFRMSERRDLGSRIGTSQTIKAVPSQLELHSLIQQWFGHSNFFDTKHFTVKKEQKTEEKIECQYDGIVGQLRATLKETKTVTRFQDPPSLGFTFHWKVAFVDSPSIPSFASNLNVTLELRPKKVMMRAQPVSLQKTSYFIQQFRQSVQTMVENFGRFVSRHFNGDCEIHLDQQCINERAEETSMNDSISMSHVEMELMKVSPSEEHIRMSDGFMTNKRNFEKFGTHVSSNQLISSASQSPTNMMKEMKTEASVENEPKKAVLTSEPQRKQRKLLLILAILLAALLMLPLLS